MFALYKRHKVLLGLNPHRLEHCFFWHSGSRAISKSANTGLYHAFSNAAPGFYGAIWQSIFLGTNQSMCSSCIRASCRLYGDFAIRMMVLQINVRCTRIILWSSWHNVRNPYACCEEKPSNCQYRNVSVDKEEMAGHWSSDLIRK